MYVMPLCVELFVLTTFTCARLIVLVIKLLIVVPTASGYLSNYDYRQMQ